MLASGVLPIFLFFPGEEDEMGRISCVRWLPHNSCVCPSVRCVTQKTFNTDAWVLFHCSNYNLHFDFKKSQEFVTKS